MFDSADCWEFEEGCMEGISWDLEEEEESFEDMFATESVVVVSQDTEVLVPRAPRHGSDVDAAVHAWQSSKGTMSVSEREALRRLLNVLPFSVAPTGTPDSSRVVGLGDMVFATREFIRYVPGGHRLTSVTALWGGAEMLPPGALEQLAVWDGTQYCGTGTFKCDAIAPKIDGVPMYPFSVTYHGKEKHCAWMYMYGGYYVYNMPFAMQGPLEVRTVGRGRYEVYARKQYPAFSIGGELYSFVVVEPLCVDQYRDLKHMDVSDGYILISGLAEYKVKNRLTVDLLFRDGVGKTSDNKALMLAEIPDGVHEVNYETRQVIRPRPDKRVANAYATVRSVIEAPTVTAMLVAIGKLVAEPKVHPRVPYLHRRLTSMGTYVGPASSRHVLCDTTLTPWSARVALRYAGYGRKSNAYWDPSVRRWVLWHWAFNVR